MCNVVHGLRLKRSAPARAVLRALTRKVAACPDALGGGDLSTMLYDLQAERVRFFFCCPSLPAHADGQCRRRRPT